MREFGYPPELYKDARPERYKKSSVRRFVQYFFFNLRQRIINIDNVLIYGSMIDRNSTNLNVKDSRMIRLINP